MNFKKMLVLILGVILSIGMAGCAPAAVTPEPVPTQTEAVSVVTEQTPVETQTTVAAGETQTDATPTIDVDALIREKLVGHHSVDRVYAAVKTREEWNVTLDRMIGYGAKISEEEKQIIIEYLLNR